jgi:hypothetical protein
MRRAVQEAGLSQATQTCTDLPVDGYQSPNGAAADVRARESEAQMTDAERFSLLVSVMGRNAGVSVRDERIPDGVPMSAGHVPGVSRLAIPALHVSDRQSPCHQPRIPRG